jgi:hypothetical protein
MANGVSGKTVRTDRAREAFLAQLRHVPNVSAAARAAGMGRTAAYAWRDDDEEFASAWDEAVQESVDALEQVAWERAQTTSDRLIEVLLKGHRPEKYTDRKLLGSDPENPLPQGFAVNLVKADNAG